MWAKLPPKTIKKKDMTSPVYFPFLRVVDNCLFRRPSQFEVVNTFFIAGVTKLNIGPDKPQYLSY